jgi:hypothetical protein
MLEYKQSCRAFHLLIPDKYLDLSEIVALCYVNFFFLRFSKLGRAGIHQTCHKMKVYSYL